MEDPVVVKRRPVFAFSSWFMVVLLFVPTLRVCGDPTAPISFPPAYLVHAGSLVAALVAFAVTFRARRALFATLVTIWLIAAGMIAVGVASTLGAGAALSAGLAAIVCIIVAIAHLARVKTLGERAVLGVLVAHALICLGWYALLAVDHDAMIGAYLGVLTALVMFGSAVAALVDHEATAATERRANRPAPLPIARMLT